MPKSREQVTNAPADLVQAVATALQGLIASDPLDLKIARALEIIGRVTGVDRTYIFENQDCPETRVLLMSQRFEWARESVSIEINNPMLQKLPYSRVDTRWQTMMAANEIVIAKQSTFTKTESEVLSPQGILSLAAVPIFIKDEFWGFIGFDECHEERDWQIHELETLRAAASGVGTAILLDRIENDHRHAMAILEDQAAELRMSRSVSLSLIEDAKMAEARAEAANSAKSRFLAVMSHEMRTPLNAIIGFTDLILSSAASASVLEYAGTIHTSGKHLLRLINDVLDLSKIESGTIVLDPVPASPGQIAENVIESLSGTAEKKLLMIELETAESLPEAAIFDATRFGQILMNLVGNSLKFTESGGIRVMLSSGPDPSGDLRIECSVMDTGIGLEPEVMSRIFDPFTQASESVHRRFGGTGLGLAISRQLCELMGGRMEVQSRHGQGSTFSFWVLAKPCENPGEVPKSETPDPAIPHLAGNYPLNILVVDDVSANRKLIQTILARMGYAVAIADSGEAACEAAAAQEFDLVLMDVLMPGMDGCEAAERIIQEACGKGPGKVPKIVALSADAMSDNQQRCFDSGMHGFLSKPIRISELVATIRGLPRDGK